MVKKDSSLLPTLTVDETRALAFLGVFAPVPKAQMRDKPAFKSLVSLGLVIETQHYYLPRDKKMAEEAAALFVEELAELIDKL